MGGAGSGVSLPIQRKCSGLLRAVDVVANPGGEHAVLRFSAWSEVPLRRMRFADDVMDKPEHVFWALDNYSWERYILYSRMRRRRTMQYYDFKGEKISQLGFGAMRMPVIDGVDENLDEPRRRRWSITPWHMA